MQSDELIAAEFDGNQNYRPDFNPTKLNGHDLHFNVNKHSTVYPTLQEMRQAHPFDENLLNSLSAQIYDKHSASKSLFGHFVKCRSEISTNLNQNVILALPTKISTTNQTSFKHYLNRRKGQKCPKVYFTYFLC